MADTLRGHVERITFYNPENSFTVAKLHTSEHQELVCVVGPMPSVQPGEMVRCIGKWQTHPTHGRQFIVEHTSIEAPAGVLGIRKYLESGLVKGIGPIYAARIVEQFGEETLQVIDEQPSRLLEVPGIGKGRLRKICNCWAEQRSIREVMVFLQSFGVSPAFAQRIYKALGADSIAKVRANPYLLARDVKGIGFKTADVLAQQMGIEPEAPTRIAAGIEFVLAQLSEEGHVCYPRAELMTTAAEILEVEPELVDCGVVTLIAEERLVCKDLTHDGDRQPYLWRKALYLTEQGIGIEIRRLMRAPSRLREVHAAKALAWVQERLKLKLARKQQEAVAAAMKGKMLIITGGPGTGKSTITRAILTLLGKLTKRITLAAPTGRAAKRMTEITSRHAQTIHSLLEWDFKLGAFRRGRNSPLQCDLLIVDEASMIDTVLMYSLLKAIPNQARLILVGDIDQLPSVGPGNVLKDIISSEAVPVVTLCDIFRQAAGSQIVINAHRINAGKFPYLPNDSDSDFFFLEETDPQQLKDRVLDLVSKRLPRRYRFDPLDDIQVLAPMRRGIIGTLQLNTALQAVLNPTGTPLFQAGNEFREGDKVMQIRNNYEKKVYNGDVGRIVRITPSEHQLVVRYDSREVTYAFLELDELMLAYAVSIHKYQGSECPCIVIPVHTSHFKLLHRNLLYTGVTRGKRLVVLVGSKKALAIAIHNDEVRKRYTGLKTVLHASLR